MRVAARRSSFPPLGDLVLSLHTPARVHIIAVGGAAMGPIATILHACGHVVSGSDQNESAMLDTLRRLGVTVHVGHRAEHVADVEIVIHSAAVRPGNIELDAALERGIPCLNRADAMGVICADKRVIAVSGAHGKTTTSAMLATLMVDAGEDPSFLVGSTVARFGSGVRWTDSSEWFVLEADESDGSFLCANAEAVIVTNADPDHLDFWGTEEALLEGYGRFIDDATIAVVCVENPNSAQLAASRSDGRSNDRMHTYGWFPNGDWKIENLVRERLGSRFRVVGPDGTSTDVVTHVPGDHNALNATAAFVLLRRLGIDASVLARSMATFGGVARRFEFRGEANGVTFVDDYAHLPAEVATNVASAARAGWSRVIAIFQPHRFTRVRDVGREFASSFSGADIVIICGLYAAGQAPIDGITGRTVFDAVDEARRGGEQYYCETRAELADLVPRLVREGDLVLTMNAGDLTTFPDEMLASAWGSRQPDPR